MADPRVILHVDMDAFFASIEQRDNPELRGKPVLVGGTGRRGVVAAASYEARQFGCRSAQPSAIARRLCPDGIFVKPRGRVYRDVSKQVFEILARFTPVVEPLSVDEAFMDVTGSTRLFGDGPTIARSIKKTVRDELDLTCSIGVAPNKFLAKLSSDFDKPDGMTIVPAHQVIEFLWPLDIRLMWGVGPAMENRLRELGIRTFGDVQEMPQDVLRKKLGSYADRLIRLTRGDDDRAVIPHHAARSVSHEQTFGDNLTNPDDVRRVLYRHVESVARRLRDKKLRGRCVVIKIRFGDFETITRSITLPQATDATGELMQAAGTLFDQWAAKSFKPVRLIGMGVNHLTEAGEQLELFPDRTNTRLRELDNVADVIAAKYGRDAIHRGTVVSREAPKSD